MSRRSKTIIEEVRGNESGCTRWSPKCLCQSMQNWCGYVIQQWYQCVHEVSQNSSNVVICANRLFGSHIKAKHVTIWQMFKLSKNVIKSGAVQKWQDWHLPGYPCYRTKLIFRRKKNQSWSISTRSVLWHGLVSFITFLSMCFEASNRYLAVLQRK